MNMLVNFGSQLALNSSWGVKRFFRVFCATLLLIVSAILLWPEAELQSVSGETDKIANWDGEVVMSSTIPCDVDVEFIRKLGIHNLARYRRQEIIASPSSSTLQMTQTVEAPILDQMGPMADGCSNPNPIRLQVPAVQERANAPHIDFGVATTLERLNDSLDTFAHWAGHTNARIFALIEPADYDQQISEVESKAANLGIELSISQSNEDYNRRYFALVEFLAQKLRPETRWSCIIDDDTFFLSMSALVKVLDRYNASESVYLGSISENEDQLKIWGYMAYGGAGVILSRALLEALGSVYELCQWTGYTGDRKISYCVFQYTDARLTIERGLHQLDLHGDPAGFFESGREPPLSVHHWKSWFEIDVMSMASVARICGDSCLLRRWQFADHWVLTNGFSIVQYSQPLDLDDRTMEQTWEDGPVHDIYLYSFGPLRPKDPQKISYRLEHAVDENDAVHQYYIRRDPHYGAEILELVWRMES